MAQPNKVHLKVQSRTGFDKSFYNDLTTNVGTLTPVLFDEVIPNSNVNLNVAASVQLPPLASDTFMKCDLKLEAFAVPLRLLYGGFMKWFVQQSAYVLDDYEPTEIQPAIPSFVVGSNWDTFPSLFDEGLSDYLGLRLCSDSFTNASVNILPYLAYGKIYDDYYRNVLVQKQLFADGVDPNRMNSIGVATLPFFTLEGASAVWSYAYEDDNMWQRYVDETSCFSLRQRNYGFDYFTNAWPSPQVGQAMSVQTDSDGKFTIASLRVANSLQQYSERMLYSPRYNEAIKQRYGCDISDAIVQRPYYLGSASINIKSYGVDVNATNEPFADTQNPFASSAGAQLGRAVGQGVVNLIDNFEVREPSYIMVLASVVPTAVYATGTRRIMRRYVGSTGGFTDMAVATLQNVGNQPIYGWELNGRINTSTVFAYTDRFADWCTMLDEVHGNLREGKDLAAFALKRDFYNEFAPNIGYRFLEIPTTALDEVAATATKISDYGAWMQFGFDYRVVMPLAFNSMPSLQDPAYEHGFDIEVKRGGFRL